jgi:hypothetical protein
MGVQALLLNGLFRNGTSSGRANVLGDIMSKFQPIEILLYHCHCLFQAKVSCHPIVVSFSNHLRTLA